MGKTIINNPKCLATLKDKHGNVVDRCYKYQVNHKYFHLGLNSYHWGKYTYSNLDLEIECEDREDVIQP